MSAEPEILAAWQRVLESGTYVLGPELDAFEQEFAAYLGVKYCVGVSSGTDALTLILRSTIEPGDEVLVPALTFIATAEAVIQAGGVPVFCDVDRETWCLTAETIGPHLTGRSAAILPVHLFGNPAPLGDFAGKYGLPVIEDACQAVGARHLGARVGGVDSSAGAFSFYPSKTLAGCGDGGAITTDDAHIAERVRLFRHHGSADGRIHYEVGGTHRLDELQAAALRIRLAGIDEKVAEQRRVARVLADEGHELQAETEPGGSAWHRHVSCTTPRMPGLRTFYETPLHMQPSMRPYWRCDLPNAEHFGRTNVCLTPGSTRPLS